ncbi:MAG: putative bifunctional diguanylate cyclase/phosphodiesterase [Rhizobiaceae bacterium]
MNAQSTQGHLPTDTVYQSFVESVFSDYKLLLIGVPTSVAAVLLTAYQTGSSLLYAIAAAMFIMGAVRYVITARFHKARSFRDFTMAEYSLWDTRYTIGAVLHALTFGVWCFVSALSNNVLAEFTSYVVTFANLIGVCGRCFPIPRLVNGQIFAVGVPLIAGLFIQGGQFLILAIMLVPYMIGLHTIAARQRDNLLNNVVNRQTAEQLATQFNTALENVPQGICMFDSQGNLEVANRHIGTFIGKPTESLKNIPISELINMLNRDLNLSSKHTLSLHNWLSRPTDKSLVLFFELGSKNKRSIKFRASRMQNGGFVTTFEDISREVDAASKIEHMVRFDRLTGLMNRNQLPDYIDKQLAKLPKDEKCAVLLVNLDRFKQVNDTLGHSKGDILLRGVAERLSKMSADLGICARYGGDEFAVVIREKGTLDLAAHLADSICESFSHPFRLGGRKVVLECSIGVVLSGGKNETAEQMLKNADLALLSAKKHGRGDWRVFNAEMSREMQRRHKLENDLRVALAGSQFEAHYQPLVNVKEAQVTVCEALLRWKHPTNGYISPASFVPIAEELGLISDISSWMLFEACHACASWPGQIRVAVNLSPIQFKQGDLAETVKNALASSGLEPERLELEITESLMLENVGQTIELLNQLKRMGVRISLDDFGTGYSSLSYMNELPLDKVKIDRSFVMDIEETNSLTLVQAVTALGHKLGLTVVVEGIETTQQLKTLLANAPVDEIQGYLFSKPVDSEMVRSLLDKRQLANKSMLAKLKANGRIAA